MSQWYLSKNGQALGPLAEDRLIELIKGQDVSPMDLVYRTGATEWLPISQVVPFAELFKASGDPEPNPQDSGAKEWVLLKRNSSDKGSEFKQLGPFSHKQLLQLIDEGSVKFNDYVWRQGMESWVKISQVEDFATPLPSTPKIDVSLYERTDADISAQTLTDKEQKRSLTHLVSIEKFEHEKKSEPPQAPQENTQVDAASSSTVDGVTEAPINNEDFVTETGVPVPGEESEVAEVSLWSLEPPSTAEIPRDLEGQKQLGQNKKTKKPKKTAAKKEKQDDSKGSAARVSLTYEQIQWATVIGIVLLSVFFFYKSFQVKDQYIEYDQQQSERINFEQEQRRQAIEEHNRKQQAPDPQSKIEARQSIERKPQPRRPEPKKIKVTPKKAVAKKTKKSRKPSSVTSKAEKLKAKARKVAKSKSVDPAKASVPQVNKTVKKNSSIHRPLKGAKVSGGKKAKSFYEQRDRKALFYSSLRGETLSVDIERQFKKLARNPKAWNRYYRQWKKKVKNSLSRDIRQFPESSEKYAYPEIIGRFKKDYDLIYQYGEVFNAKVTKGRVPSGAPQNMQRIFSRYKQEAQSLGR